MARLVLVAAAFVVVVAALPAVRAEEKAKEAVKVEAGKPAPEFTLKDHDGKDVKLASFRGKKSVLVAFYPKDFTGG